MAPLVLFFALPVHGLAKDPGGRDLTVSLFTAHNVQAITITPLATGAWTAACATCVHKPLTASMKVLKGDIYAGGTLRVADMSDAAMTAAASGVWQARYTPQGIDVVLTIPSERYTAAVVSAEADAHEPAESLQALAIVARTYALNGSHYHASIGHLPADLCDSTQCQAIRLGPISQSIRDAVNATAGETLWFAGKRAEVFFSQHCGGQTADATEAWSSSPAAANRRAEPYLASHPDPYCLRQGPAAWHTSVSLSELKMIAQREGWRLPARIYSVRIAQRTRSGRAARLVFRSETGEEASMNASALRFAVGRTLGWNRIRSDLYEIALRDHALVFDGRGHGHGVGLCQAGATEMARTGKTARAILAFYFPGTQLRISPGDDGWVDSRAGAVRMRSSSMVSTETRTQVMQAWTSALQLFPVARPPEPLVVIAPSTELFRQMTGQPGWDLAGTRDNVVTLQPQQLFREPRALAERTLRHELLHVLIENEATNHAPLWLREGLAEALAADEKFTSSSAVTAIQLDAALQHAASISKAQSAHAEAGARVHLLIARYGLPCLRGWLKSGIPASISAGR